MGCEVAFLGEPSLPAGSLRAAVMVFPFIGGAWYVAPPGALFLVWGAAASTQA